MKVLVWESPSKSLEEFLELAQRHVDIDLFEDIEDLVVEVEAQDLVVLDLDFSRKIAEKAVKNIRKSKVPFRLTYLTNVLKPKDIVKHQKSKVGADFYLRSPVDEKLLLNLLRPIIGSALKEDFQEAQHTILSEHRGVESVGEDIEAINGKLDSAFMDALGEVPESGKVLEEILREEEKEQRFPTQPPSAPTVSGVSLELSETDIQLDDAGAELSLSEEDEEPGALGTPELSPSEESADGLELGIGTDPGLELAGNSQESVGIDLATMEESALELGGEDMDLEIAGNSEDSPSLDLDSADSDELSLDMNEGSGFEATEEAALEVNDEVDMEEELSLEEEVSLDLDSQDSILDLGDEPSLNLEQDEVLESEEDSLSLELADDSLAEEVHTSESEELLASEDLGEGMDLELGSDEDLGFDLSGEAGEAAGLEGDEDIEPIASASEEKDELTSISLDLPADLDASMFASGDMEGLEDFSSETELNDDREDILEKDEITSIKLCAEDIMGDELSSESLPHSPELEAQESDDMSDSALEKLAEIEEMMKSDASEDEDLFGLNLGGSESEGLSSAEEMDLAAQLDLDEPDYDPTQEDEATDSLEVSHQPEDDPDSTLVFSAGAEQETKADMNDSNLDENRFAQKTIADQRESLERNDEEFYRLGETIKHLRLDREELLNKISILEDKQEGEKLDFSNLRAELDEKKIELALVNKRRSKQIEDLSYRLELSEEKRLLLEEKCKRLEQENESLRKKSSVDVNRIRGRERELESKLDLLKADTETQLKNRDIRILELKRKIDTLEFDIESIQMKEKKTVDNNYAMEERMERVINTLRRAIGELESEDTPLRDIEKIKNNLDV